MQHLYPYDSRKASVEIAYAMSENRMILRVIEKVTNINVLELKYWAIILHSDRLKGNSNAVLNYGNQVSV